VSHCEIVLKVGQHLATLRASVEWQTVYSLWSCEYLFYLIHTECWT